MKNISNFYPHYPELKDVETLPPPGKYYALITGVDTCLIAGFEGVPKKCLVVSYKLASVDTLEVYALSETYFLDEKNARSEDFLAFLQTHGLNFTSECEMIGLKATVEVTYDFLAGYVYPIISFRKWRRCNQMIVVKSTDDLPF